MIVLGIESTAHTFGAGIFDGKRIRANEWDREMGEGIVPAQAASHHEKVAESVCKRALEKAGIEWGDVDLIAFSMGPGLPPCLWAGYKFCKNKAKKLGLEIVGVNHCIAHIEIGKFDTGATNPLTLYVSGGNTMILGYADHYYRIYGETLDIGLGNALDKVARAMGLKMPGGKYIEQLAKRGKYIPLPYTVKGMDLMFSGIVTAAKKLVGKERKEDIAFSLQETLFAMVTEVLERALAYTKKEEVLLTGGVAANKRLRQMIGDMVKEHGAKFYVPEMQYCMDNGAMIAYTGFLAKKYGWESIDKPNPKWRPDGVRISLV